MSNLFLSDSYGCLKYLPTEIDCGTLLLISTPQRHEITLLVQEDDGPCHDTRWRRVSVFFFCSADNLIPPCVLCSMTIIDCSFLLRVGSYF